MQIVVRERKIALRPCQRKHHLRQLGRMMRRIRIGLQEILQRALTLLHHGGDHRNIGDLGPCKGLVAVFTDILPKTGSL